MERFNPVPIAETWVCVPSPMAQAYGEQVAPVVPSRPSRFAGQIFPPPPELSPSRPTHPPRLNPETFQAKRQMPYVEGEKQLPLPPTDDASDAKPQPQGTDEAPQLRYATASGRYTFEELHDDTRRYVAAVLLRRYGLHPSRMDDALQGGYLRMLRRLHARPDAYADKGKAYFATQLVFDALHSLSADGRYQRRIQDGEGHSTSDSHARHSPESRQTDVRHDLHQAIAQVAQAILSSGNRRRHIELDLWALYGLTMQQVTALEMSQLFQTRKQSMQAAYRRVREMLQTALPGYALPDARPYRQRGRERLPREDLAVIRQSNQSASAADFEVVRRRILALEADTQAQDLIALDGIRRGITVREQACASGQPAARLKRAYNRVHLLLGAERDPTVRVKRADKRKRYVFVLTPETEAAVHQLALELINAPRSYEKLVALHTHISNLAVSTTAKHFRLPTATLRYFVQQIGERLGTPQQSAPWLGVDRS